MNQVDSGTLRMNERIIEPRATRPQKPDGIKAPGLAFRRHNGGWKLWWQPRSDLTAKGYDGKCYQLWPTRDTQQDAIEPTADEWQTIDKECGRLHREQQVWTRAKSSRPENEQPPEPPPPSPDDYGVQPPSPPPPSTMPAWPDMKNKEPMRTCANARLAIAELGIDCSYDVFHDRKLVGGHEIEQWAGELSDHAIHMLRVVIKGKFGLDPGKENTSDAAMQLCLQNQFDPVCDYLDSLDWDRVKRLDSWMTTYLGAADTVLNRTIGRLSLVAAVRRARQPGCKFDQVIVLEGPEGKGKSKAIQILAGAENFSDQTILGLDDRQQQEAMRGVWLYEMGELSGMSKADIDKTKAFLSRQTDRARPAYGRHAVSQPRRCIFFATTNDDTYLKSQTGNRRWWPVKAGRIDLPGLAQDRDQLWAEAVALEASGASIELPESLWGDAAIEQDKRRDQDPWEDILGKVKGIICNTADGRQEERISTADLLILHLKMPPEKCSDAHAKRLKYCMQRLGWEKPPGVIRIADQGVVRGFRRPVRGEAVSGM